MTRVLYWNVLGFGPNGLYPPSSGKRGRRGDDDDEYGVPAAPKDAADRRGVLRNVVTALTPDIISIVEVLPGGAVEGTPVVNAAVKSMLGTLRAAVPGANYRVVPPLVTGAGRRAEGIAVFYAAANLRFLGPWGWGGAGAVDPAGGGLATYAAPWSAAPAALPNRTFSAAWHVAAPWLPAGCNENTLSGRWNFDPPMGAPVLFPAAGYRRPWLTAFGDAAGRVIKLFTMHNVPQLYDPPGLGVAAKRMAATAQSRAAIAALAGLPEVAGAMAANEVRCIVGDFNISAFDAASDPGSYGLLRAAGYRQALNPGGYGGAPVIPYTWPSQGYYATHIKSAANSDPFVSVGAQPTIHGYPGFGYVSTNEGPGNWYDSIDHVFTRYPGANASANFTVINPVAGSPYNVDTAPPANVLHGVRAVGSQLGAPGVFDFDPANGQHGISENDLAAADAGIAFRLWDNYGKVRSLSDHLPLYIEV